MSTVLRFLTLFVAAATGGCLGALNSAVPDSATILELQLLGTWSDSASSERAIITQSGPRSYAIQYTDDQGQTVSLVGQLGRSRHRFILDIQPTAEALGPYKDLVVRLHIPLILDSIGPRIHVAILEPDSLDQYLRRNPRAIAHGRTHDGLALTAGSTELEKFFAAYLQRPGVLATPSTWVRRSP